MTRSTILVTGGAGFVGSHFARIAHDTGRDVVIIDDLSGGPPIALPGNVRLIIGDIGDGPLVRRVCREHRVGSVAHFAGRTGVADSVRHPDEQFDVNVVRALRLLQVITDEHIEAFLYSTTAAVYGTPKQIPIPEIAPREPVNPYGATKLAFEFALDAWSSAHGLRWAAMRYFNAAGAHPDGSLRENHVPETHLIPRAIDAGLRTGPALEVFGNDYDTEDGTCVRDYVHVVDLATGHMQALAQLERGRNLGPINLGTGHGYSVFEVVRMVQRVLGQPVPHSVVPRRPGDPPRLIADTELSRLVLGWMPERSDLETIIEDAVRSRRLATVRLVAASLA